MKKLIYGVLLLVAIGFYNCEKEIIHENVENQENKNADYSFKKSTSNEIDEKLADYVRKYNGRQVKGDFIGRIINENNDPIEGAKVIIGGLGKETDENGIVSFTNAQVQQYFAHIRASADGYLDGSRVIVPDLNENNQNNFTIKLFKFNSAARIHSEKGGEISFKTDKGEGFVYFNPGFIDEFGNSYNGTVAVSINYLDPLNPDTANTMPGDLYGITQGFEQVALGSYGMIQVELRGTSGQKLQIVDPAKLIMPIHPDQIGTAASQVPMWSFNEHAGVWYEETIAYRNGNQYEAEVSHFSFWNCDAPFPVVNFSATVVDAATLSPISGLRVEIIYNGFIRNATTNATGVVSGKIPSNQTMMIRILDVCGNVLYLNTSFGPFGAATNITIPVTINPLQAFTLSGTVTDCSSSPVTNGYVTLSSSSGQHIASISVTAGTYSYTGIGCVLPTNVTITGVDFSTAQGSITIATVNPGPNTLNIVICGGLSSEYIRYRVNTTTGPYQYDLMQPRGFVGINRASVQASNSTGTTYIFSNTTTLGTGYPFGTGLNTMFVEALSHINGLNPNATMALTTPMTFDLVAITPGPGGIGTYISIDFAGNYVDNNLNTNYIEGEARIYRDQ